MTDALVAPVAPALPAQEMPWWALPGLGLVVLLSFDGALVASCFLGDNTLRTQMFTAAAVSVGTILGYFFGSAVGSRGKDATIAAAMRGAPPATTPPIAAIAPAPAPPWPRPAPTTIPAPPPA